MAIGDNGEEHCLHVSARTPRRSISLAGVLGRNLTSQRRCLFLTTHCNSRTEDTEGVTVETQQKEKPRRVELSIGERESMLNSPGGLFGDKKERYTYYGRYEGGEER
jgi:hypothetical protein